MSYDLRPLLERFGGDLTAGVTTAPADRDEVSVEVVMRDETPSRVTAEPGAVAAYIDGIQAAVTLCWSHSRPVCLQYAGAGAGLNGALLATREELRIACGVDDEEWVREAAGEIPVVVVAGDTPTEVMRSVADALGGLRERLERDLCSHMLESSDQGLIVCDGSVVGRPKDDRIVGVVKTTATRYLADESQLWSLGAGWRSARFTIPAGRDMPVARHSAYVRLHDARRRGWDFGLIRVETFELDAIDAVCAMALSDIQDGSWNDNRWDRHLRSVRTVEDLMRSRRPPIF